MKKKKLLVSCVLHNVHPVAYGSQMSSIYRIGKYLPDWELIFHSPVRRPIDSARNEAAQYALELECDYLFFFDDDMLPHPDVVRRLLERMNDDTHIVMARCYIRGWPFHPMIFNYKDLEAITKEKITVLGHYTEEEYKPNVREDGLVKVDAVGCASTMIDVELFKLMDKPWFLTGAQHTEDVYFCMKAKDHVEEVGIFMDDNVECGHLMERPILNERSRKILLELDEKGLDQVFSPKGKRTQQFNYSNPLLEGEKS